MYIILSDINIIVIISYNFVIISVIKPLLTTLLILWVAVERQESLSGCAES